MTSRDDLLRLADQVEGRLLESDDKHRLRLLEACYEHIAINPEYHPAAYLLGEIRDVHTLRALAKHVGLDWPR